MGWNHQSHRPPHLRLPRFHTELHLRSFDSPPALEATILQGCHHRSKARNWISLFRDYLRLDLIELVFVEYTTNLLLHIRTLTFGLPADPCKSHSRDTDPRSVSHLQHSLVQNFLLIRSYPLLGSAPRLFQQCRWRRKVSHGQGQGHGFLRFGPVHLSSEFPQL